MPEDCSIDYIVGPTKGSVYGIKRYQDAIHSRLPLVRLNRLEYSVPQNRLLSIIRRAFFTLEILARAGGRTPKHFTTQYLAYLVLLPGMENSVVTVYDTVFIERISDFPFLNRMMMRLNIEGIKRARKIITISDYSARQISSRLGVPSSRIIVIKPGIDLAFFKKAKRLPGDWGAKGHPVILALSSEDPRQNIDKILLAIAQLKKEFPGIVFLKAGNPQWIGAREKLTALVEKLSLQKNVRFLNYVPESKLPSLYASADVFVYPCSSTGWGLPPAEAMACGIPVVTSKTPPLPEVVGNGALKVDPGSAEGIAYAIGELLKNKGLRANLAKQGRKHLRSLSWGKAAKLTGKVYRSMLR